MNASQKSGGPRNVARNGVREGNREFPSFIRLLDTVSTAQTASRPFAPLRFTLDPSKWNNRQQQQARPQLIRPTLISPPTRHEDGTKATAQKAHNAPLFPTMEEFKADAAKSLKRPASDIPPTSFLPYKKRAIAPTVSSEHLDESARRSPEYLEQLVANEPRMKEAASILLDMRSLSTTSETEEIETLPRIVSQGSVATSVDTEDTSRSTLTETPVNHAESEQPAAAPPIAAPTRTVTPAPNGMRLAFPEDAHELNSLHCFVRAELLEVFALPTADEEANQVQSTSRSSSRRNTSTSGRSYASGRVGLRCVYCAHLPRRARAGSTMVSYECILHSCPLLLRRKLIHCNSSAYYSIVELLSKEP